MVDTATVASDEDALFYVLMSGNQYFKMSRKALSLSLFLKEKFETGPEGQAFFVSFVRPKILQMIIEWCEYHKTGTTIIDDEFCPNCATDALIKEWVRKRTLGDWEKKFFEIEQEEFFELFIAAENLEVRGLREQCAKLVADYLKDKSVEEIQAFFGVKDDYSDAEKEQLLRENSLIEKDPS